MSVGTWLADDSDGLMLHVISFCKWRMNCALVVN